MESWQQAPFAEQGGGTFSHPWTAAPAYVIPRFLMGLRPLEDAWSRIAIKPLPSAALTSASLEVLTARGTVKLAFARQASSFTANVTIPGNTLAQVCLPRYLLSSSDQSSKCSATLADKEVPSANAGGLLCLSTELGGGFHTVKMSC